MKKATNGLNLEWSKKIKEIEIEICKQKLDTIKSQLATALSDESCQTYISMTPTEIFLRLLEIVEENIEFENDNDQKYLIDLINELKENELYQYLMNLAMFLGKIKEPPKFIVNTIGEESVVQVPSSPSTEAVTTNNKLLQQQKQHQKVPVNKLCANLYKLINASDGLFRLLTLIEIQQNICKEYKIDENDFTLLGHGDFIHFLHNHQKTIGSSLEFYLFNPDSCGGIKRTELYRFVQKLFKNDIHDNKIIEKAIKYHFNLQNLKQIGFSNIDQLRDRVQNQQQNENFMTTIQYVIIKES